MARNEQSWEASPIRATLLRVGVFILPLIVGFGVAILLSRLIPSPGSILGVIVWWLGIVAVSTAALRLTDRFAKRLLPLAVLMKLSLVFPDKAPGRYSTALRSGGTRNLEKLLEEAERVGRSDDTARAAEVILGLAAALNDHDPRTRGHTERVRAYADMLGEEMGLTAEERNKLAWAAMLHDIGKLRVPTEIINKPGKLDESEWKVIQRHPEWGMELAAPLAAWMGDFMGAIGQHHERFDGTGYPNGLAGEEISLAARITSVADSFDVMTSVRSYKEAHPAGWAREELARCAGSQFDPEVVRAFLNIAIGRQRWVAGPLSWLSQIPLFQSGLQAATTAATNAATAVSTAVAATAITGTALMAPALLNAPGYALSPAPIVAPAPVDDGLIVTEDSEVIGIVLDNDGGDLDPGSVSIIEGPFHGFASVLADGTIRYVPDADFNGTDTIRYRVCNIVGECGSAEITVTVQPANDPPVWSIPAVATDEEVIATFPVLGWASDPDGSIDAATLQVVGIPVHGTAAIGAGGALTYVPPPDFSGTDTMDLRICDDEGACVTGRLSVTVRPLNDPPRLAVGPVAIVEDTPTLIEPDATDPDGDVLIGRVVEAPAHGSVVVESAGRLRYAPDADYAGPDTFSYEVCDPAGLCARAEVEVTVTPVNDPPRLPTALSLSTPEDTPVTFNPLASARDPEGGPVVLARFDPAGTAGGTIGAGLVYKPPPGWSGVDTFTYTVRDAEGATQVVTVTVAVAAVNDAPVGAVPPLSTPEDTPVSFDPADHFTDEDGDPISVVALVPVTASGATLSLDGAGRVVYTPAADYHGTDSFTMVVGDGVGGTTSTSVTVTVTPVNDTPVAMPDTVTTPLDTPITIFVTANDVDVDGDSFGPGAVTIVAPPGHGGYWVGMDGSITYAPDAGFVGPEFFTYTVSDGTVTSAPALVTVAVKTVVGIADDYSVDEDSTLTVAAPGLLDNDLHPDGTTLTVTLDAAPADGSVVLQPDGSFIYQPAEDFHGTETFTYHVTDGARSDTGTVTVTVLPIPDEPGAVDDAFATDRDTAVVVAAPGILWNDNDHDEDTLTASLVTGPGDGTLVSFGSDGSFNYRPDPGFVGTDTFTYQIDDGTGRTDTAEVRITVDSGVTADGLFFGTSGSGSDDWALVAFPPSAATPVPDYDGDGNPGLTIEQGGKLDEDDPLQYQNWTVAPAAPLQLDGPVTLKLWSTAENFSLDDGGAYRRRSVHPELYLQDCAADGTGCVLLLETDLHIGDWNGGTAGWVYHEIPLGSLTHTVVPGRMLQLHVTFGHHSVWIAATADYPSRLSLTAANQPPSVVDDILDDVNPAATAPAAREDVTVSIDVLANDGDVNLDPATLAIARVPATGTATVAAGMVDYAPAADFFGSTDFDYQVCDTSGACSTATVYVTIVGVNDAPSFTAGAAQSVPEDSAGQTVAGWASGMSPGPLNEAGQALGFSVSADLPAMFSVQPAVDALTGGLTYTPAPNAVGTATITVRLVDDGGTADAGQDTSAPQTFTITLTPVNDAPSFTVGADQSVPEDSGAHTVAGWATGISAGPSDEAGQALSFTATTDNDPLFSVLPAATASGDLTYTLAPGAVGSATVTLTLADDGGTAGGGSDTSGPQTFTIDVFDVNDPPAFDLPVTPDQSIAEDPAVEPFVAGFATSIVPGPLPEEAGQTVTFYVSTDNDALFGTLPDIDETTGDLSYEPAVDASGSALVSVYLTDDGGTAFGGNDASPVQTFTITVTPVNDPPALDVNEGLYAEAGATTFITTSELSASDVDNLPAEIIYTVITNVTKGILRLGPLPLGAGDTFTQADLAGGTVAYQHSGPGDDSFTFGISDGTVTIGPFTFDIKAIVPTALISEFTTLGPAGNGDEFVELYNPTPLAISIEGWTMHLYNSAGADTSGPIPIDQGGPTTIAPFSRYLIAGAGYSRGVVPDKWWGAAALQNGGGVAIFDDGGALRDAVGSANPGPALPIMSDLTDQGYERYAGSPNGNCQDTDVDVVDFFHNMVATNPQNSSASPEACGTRPAPSAAAPTHLIISEIRTSGPAGPGDEFVEIYNPTSTPIDLLGHSVLNESFTVMYSWAVSTVLQAGQHFLLAGPTYSGPGGDAAAWGTMNPSGGAGLLDGLTTLDRAAFAGLYAEGAPLPAQSPASAVDESFERIAGCKDTDNNLVDFWHNLGTSGPQSLASAFTTCS